MVDATPKGPALQRRVAVIGAGVSGLVCAKHLQTKGIQAHVFEASDSVGGRVRTDKVSADGGVYLLDRGFQILIDSYPEVRKQLNLRALQLQSFGPGAVLANSGVFKVVADPSRSPRYFFKTMTAGIATLGDLFRLLVLRIKQLFASPYASFKRQPQTTADFLRNLNLSTTLVENFLQPFFEAIYVTPLEEQSSACFEFVLRMLADGRACLPRNGIQAVPEQLAKGLTIQTGAPVVQVRPDAIRLENDDSSNAWREFDAVVVAAGWPQALKLVPVGPVSGTRSATWYFGMPSQPPIMDPFIVLNSKKRQDDDDAVLVNIGFPSSVQRSYAPQGHSLASVTVRGKAVQEQWVREQVEDLLGCNISSWRLLAVYDLVFHQPAQVPLTVQSRPPLCNGVYICGDYCTDPTLDGAMRSGVATAEAVTKALN